MIYDKICNIDNYLGLNKNIDSALLFIKNNDLKSLPKGKTVIDGDNVFVNHFSYDTVKEDANTLFENHMKYIDLHFILSGEEIIAVSFAENLKEVEKISSEDSVIYRGESDMRFPMTKETFLMVYPGEAHLPKLVYKSRSKIDKLVFKIKI